MIRWLCLMTLLSWGLAPVASAQELAGVLSVTYGTVDIERDETSGWLPLRAGASAPLGVGDRVRTGADARALLGLPDQAAQVMILPNTVFEVVAYSATDNPDTPTFGGEVLNGEVIYRAPDATDYSIGGQLGRAFPAGQRGVHLLMSHRAGVDVLVVADGQTIYDSPDAPSVEVVAQALYQGPSAEATLVATLAPPISPAAVVGAVEGCPAVIRTAGGQNLNARTGPGTGNLLLGQFPDEARVQVMGLVAAGGWYRVQFRSGFGWVQRLALEIRNPACQVPTLPNDTFDLPSTVFDVSPPELDLMRPFYGTPDDDPIFYQPAP